VQRGADGLARMELVIAAAPGEPVRHGRRATDLVVILDRSGSMDGEKMVHARAAVGEVGAQLGAQERFALVTYADDAMVSIPLTAVDAATRARWRGTVAEIQATGGTNISSGLDLGLAVVGQGRAEGRVPHVILISDGLANQGDASVEGLIARACRAAQGEYMLSSVGVGADFNESLMAGLADAGTGNYYYVSDPRALGEVFAREFDAARTTAAAGLAVQIDPGPGVRVVDAAGYPLEPSGDGVVLRPGSLFAGQERRIWITLAVPQQTVGDYEVGRFALSYGAPDHRTTLRFAEVPRIACVQSEDEFYAGLDKDAWGRSIVVDAYNKMQQEVAAEVKAGRREEALERVRRFKEETAAMNAHVGS
ncbi:MAG: vWA domain-containing protein, partial [Myxococcota bacterium]